MVRVVRFYKKLKVRDPDTAIVLKFHLRLSSWTSSFRLRSFLSSDLQSSQTHRGNTIERQSETKFPTKLAATHFSMFATQHSGTSPGMVTCKRKNGTYIRSNKRLKKNDFAPEEAPCSFTVLDLSFSCTSKGFCMSIMSIFF